MRFYTLKNTWDIDSYASGPVPFPDDYDDFLFARQDPPPPVCYNLPASDRPFGDEVKTLLTDPGEMLYPGVWSKRLISTLKKFGAEGFSDYPISIKRGSKTLPGYRGVRITGRAGPLDLSRTEFSVEPGDDLDMKTGRGIFVDPDNWGTKDIFCIHDFGPTPCVSERLAAYLRKTKLRHVELVPNDKVVFFAWALDQLLEEDEPLPKPTQILTAPTMAKAKNAVRRTDDPSFKDFLCDHIKPSVRIHAQPVPQQKLRKGASRFCGLPDLPADTPWPGEDEGFSLSFLAQINLRDIANLKPSIPLPRTGWLCFFYDTVELPGGTKKEDAEGWRVLYFDVPTRQLRRTELPDDYDDDFETQPCALKFTTELMTPSWETLTATPDLTFHPRGQRPKRKNKPVASSEDYDRHLIAIGCRPDDSRPWHRLCGHPQEHQIAMHANVHRYWKRCYAERTTTKQPAPPKSPSDWTLLLQLDSHECGPGWKWGDAGSLYFWIPQNDLRAARFDRVWLQWECG